MGYTKPCLARGNLHGKGIVWGKDYTNKYKIFEEGYFYNNKCYKYDKIVDFMENQMPDNVPKEYQDGFRKDPRLTKKKK